jgi:two-component system CheB/CheR fusion protein
LSENKSKKKEDNPPKSANQVFPIVGIGASAGGLDAMKQLLENLPEDVGLAYVVVQHLAADQESMLPEILSRHTKMSVKKVQNGMQIKPDRVYVMPSGKTMTISKGVLKLEPKAASLRPINEFMQSLANDRKTKAIGVILSGTGTDGTEGLKSIKAEGGITLAQDPKTAHYPDMPRNAILAKTVYYVLSPEDIAEELVNIANHPEIARQKKIEAKEPTKEELTDNQKIFTHLKATFGVNFANYKKSTINRRITRRMVINKIDIKKEYVEFLRTNKEELQALFDDLLIGVTSFFREPDTFIVLKEQVFPELVDKKQPNVTIRVWVPGCSTGEEAYSIAIAIEEFLEENSIVNKQIQIFGTDANSKFIEEARRAIYPRTIADNVSEIRLNRFFITTNGNYQVKKQIRDMCVFAKHDLTLDPPFSNLDLIVCRNLLIYFDNKLQEKVIPILHYGLRNHGYLVLGQSESIGRFTNLFKPLTKKGLIFQKKDAQPKVEFQLEAPLPYITKKRFEHPTKTDSLILLQKEMDNLLSDYVPASLLLNNDLDVIVFRGKVDPYISIDSGVASLKATKIVRKDLRPTLQTGLYKAKKTKKEVEETVRTEKDKHTKIVKIKIKPVKLSKHEENFYFVIFEKIYKTSSKDKKAETPLQKETESTKDEQIKELSEELESTKHTLQMVVEQQEATNEELRSSLEEAQSSNEELMSTNEELETTKEELQSANEELATLNDELKDRNLKLTELNNDFANLMNNVDTAVVLIDNDFKIRRFTNSAQELLKLIPTDMDHPITNIRLGIPIDDLENLLNKVINGLESFREEIETEKGRWYQMRIRPYLTEEKKVGGAVLSLANVTEIKKLEAENKCYTDDLEQKVKEQTSQLIESEKMATIGKTAGMVGHDIRNPLQAIEGEIYIAKQEINAMPDTEEKNRMLKSLRIIQNRLYYINKIIMDLQDFSRKLEPNPEKVDLSKVVKETLSEIMIPETVKVTVSIEPDFPKLTLDTSYMKRILMNLLTNSIQAMPKGGNLKINAICQDDKALISVNDTGEGMSEGTKKKIFTPLFTTKSQGQGFGLAVVKRLTEAMDGTINFESEVNKGSIFTVEFLIEKED